MPRFLLPKLLCLFYSVFLTSMVIAGPEIRLFAWLGDGGRGAMVLFQEPGSNSLRYSLCNDTVNPIIPVDGDDILQTTSTPRQETSVVGAYQHNQTSGVKIVSEDGHSFHVVDYYLLVVYIFAFR